MNATGNVAFSQLREIWHGTGPLTATSLLSLVIGTNPKKINKKTHKDEKYVKYKCKVNNNQFRQKKALYMAEQILHGQLI